MLLAADPRGHDFLTLDFALTILTSEPFYPGRCKGRLRKESVEPHKMYAASLDYLLEAIPHDVIDGKSRGPHRFDESFLAVLVREYSEKH